MKINKELKEKIKNISDMNAEELENFKLEISKHTSSDIQNIILTIIKEGFIDIQEIINLNLNFIKNKNILNVIFYFKKELNMIINQIKEIKNKCIFCKKQKDRNKVIGETAHFYLIWDEFPVSDGHILVISKEHRDDYTSLSELEKIDLTQGIDLAITLIDVKYKISDVNIGINQGLVAGQSINHFHCHIIPRRFGDVEKPKGGVRGVIPPKQKY